MTPPEIRGRTIGRRRVDAVQIERDRTITFSAKRGDWLVTDDLGNQYVSRRIPVPAAKEQDSRIRDLRRDVLQLGYIAIELYERVTALSVGVVAPPIPSIPTGPTPGALGQPSPPPSPLPRTEGRKS